MLVFNQWDRRGPGDYVKSGKIALNAECVESIEPVHYDGLTYFKIQTMSGKKLYVTPLQTTQVKDFGEIFALL